MGTNIIFLLIVIINMTDAVGQVRTMNAVDKATETLDIFLDQLFKGCMKYQSANSEFELDNMKKYILTPAKTTVGFAPKYTSNRKFFANLIDTKAFKEIIDKDSKQLFNSYIRKMKYCDKSVMDDGMLKDMCSKDNDEHSVILQTL